MLELPKYSIIETDDNDQNALRCNLYYLIFAMVEIKNVIFYRSLLGYDIVQHRDLYYYFRSIGVVVLHQR